MLHRVRTKKGFTLIEIMVVVSILGLLMVIAVPNFAGARERALSSTCLANRRLLDSLIQVPAFDGFDLGSLDGFPADGTLTPNEISSLLVPGYIKRMPTCPKGSYRIPYLTNYTVECAGPAGHTLIAAQM